MRNVVRLALLIPFFLGLLVCLLSCTSSPHGSNGRTTQQVVAKAEQVGFKLEQIPTRPFLMTVYEKLPTAPCTTVHAYIEGDGNSWKTRYKLSDNPTPKQPLALRLALQDPHSHVIYLARPCQYTPHSLDPSCHPRYWSSHRYAQEVIDSMNETLDHIKAKIHNSHFVLVGFSGGASVAALLCASRQDISSLITVAGDLNHGALNLYHQTSPLRGSLNPIAIAPELKDLPQHHWYGSRDHVVPPWVSSEFVKAVNNPACAKVHELKGATHHKGWTDHWQEILQSSLTTPSASS